MRTNLSDIVEQLARAAQAAGADHAEAAVAERSAQSVTVRSGALEEVERQESCDIGLRVFFGKRHASVASSDLAPAALERLVERAVAMARLAPEDAYAGLVPADHLAQGPWPDLDLYDAFEPSAAALEALALEAEATALSVPGVFTSNGASAGFSTGSWRLFTTNGFRGERMGSGFSLSASVVAKDDQGMESGGDGRSVRHFSDLPAAALIGQTAGERAARSLGARKIDSTTAPVIFENRCAFGFLSPLLGAMSGPSVARGTSFLKDKLGAQVLPAGVSLFEDPLRRRGLGAAPFDDEGAPTRPRALYDDGVLTTFLHNAASAAQLGQALTGHASRGLAGPSGVGSHNVTLQPGAVTPAELMAQAGAGLFVTSMFGASLNANTGDWSTGVSGFWFENGALAYPVHEITIAGNLLELYARLIPANDLEIRGTKDAPSLLVDALAIGGR